MRNNAKEEGSKFVLSALVKEWELEPNAVLEKVDKLERVRPSTGKETHSSPPYLRASMAFSKAASNPG